MLVEANDGKIVGSTFRALDVLRWDRVDVDLTGAETLAEMSARLRLGLMEANATADGRPLIVRVALTGATVLHAALLADPAGVEAEGRAAAASVSGDVHIERVRVETRSPVAASHDAAEMAALEIPFLAAIEEPDIQARLIEEFRDLARLFPRQAGRAAPALPQTADELRALAPDAWAVIINRLGAGS
jgi:hypothetical protein